MHKTLFISLAVLAVLAVFATPAQASCIYPTPPAVLPEGSEANHEDMVEAHRIVREFDADIRSYTVCLELEAKVLLEDPRVDEATKDQVRRELARRHNAAIDHAEHVVALFNEQLRKYRERSGGD
jgi:hypothetical protein